MPLGYYGFSIISYGSNIDDPRPRARIDGPRLSEHGQAFLPCSGVGLGNGENRGLFPGRRRCAPARSVWVIALILLIDDDKFYRRMIRRILEDQRHEVIEAESGEEGLELYQAYKPALVITDMRMPEISGIEVIRTIHAINRQTHIIAVSGAATFYNINFLQMAKEAGANAILRKLDSFDRVVEAVTLALRGP